MIRNSNFSLALSRLSFFSNSFRAVFRFVLFGYCGGVAVFKARRGGVLLHYVLAYGRADELGEFAECLFDLFVFVSSGSELSVDFFEFFV